MFSGTGSAISDIYQTTIGEIVGSGLGTARSVRRLARASSTIEKPQTNRDREDRPESHRVDRERRGRTSLEVGRLIVTTRIVTCDRMVLIIVRLRVLLFVQLGRRSRVRVGKRGVVSIRSHVITCVRVGLSLREYVLAARYPLNLTRFSKIGQRPPHMIPPASILFSQLYRRLWLVWIEVIENIVSCVIVIFWIGPCGSSLTIHRGSRHGSLCERQELSCSAYDGVGMGEPDTFLTDERRAVLNGEYTGAANVERTHKARIKARSQSAIDELIEVASSHETNNGEIFDPKQINTLLNEIAHPSGLMDEDYQHTSEAYRNALYVAVDQFLRDWEGGR